MSLRALSVRQPWASLLALGIKRYETRSWSTGYRGWLALHTSQDRTRTEATESASAILGALLETGEHDAAVDLWGGWQRRGEFIALLRLDGCERTEAADVHPEERMVGDWTPGRWAWRVGVSVPIRPIKARGALGLWTPNAGLSAALRREIEKAEVHKHGG